MWGEHGLDERSPDFRAENEKAAKEDGSSPIEIAVKRARAWASKQRQGINELRWPADWPRILRWPALILGGFAGVAIVGAAVLLLLLTVLAPSLPMSADLYALNRPPALTFLDQSGKLAGVRGSIVGKRLKLSEMPPYLPAAFLAMEDRKFYH